ncbi:MAG: GNAT family N-acetyltransferase [Acidimicrobiales bacterium]
MPSPVVEIRIESPRTPDVVALLEHHLAFSYATTEPEHVFALDLDGLDTPSVTFVTARSAGELLGIGALKALDATHGELKSMHTVEAARGQGIARRLVEHLVGLARERKLDRVSLETGSQDAYAPARALYERCGFTPCGPFADYPDAPSSAFYTRAL